MEMVITPYPNADKPTIVFGFHDGRFSQCVYLTVDEDPLEVIKMANGIHEEFVNAAAAAVKAHKESCKGHVPDTFKGR